MKNLSGELSYGDIFCTSEIQSISKKNKDLLIESIKKNPSIVNKRGAYGETILHSAVFGRNPDLIKLLINLEAKIDAMDKDHNTPLHVAAKYGNDEAVELLLNSGANPNIQNIKGKTPLHKAVEHEKIRVVELLVKSKDINTKIKDINNKTPKELIFKKKGCNDFSPIDSIIPKIKLLSLFSKSPKKESKEPKKCLDKDINIELSDMKDCTQSNNDYTDKKYCDKDNEINESGEITDLYYSYSIN